MANVFIVTSGEYSDYCIEAVFTKREDAEVYIQLHFVDPIDAQIAKYPLDIQMDPDPGLKAFRVYHDPGYGGYEFYVAEVPKLVDGKVKRKCRYGTWGDCHSTIFEWRGYAKDKDEAKEIAIGIWNRIQAGERPNGVGMGNN